MARTKIQVGVRFDPELVERLRNAVWHVGKGHTVNSVTEAATWKALEELEVSDEDLSEDHYFGGLDFEDADAEIDDSFAEGSSQFEIPSVRKLPIGREVEWSAGVCGLLFASVCLLIIGSIVSADLLRTVWARAEDTQIDQGIAWLLAGFWK